LLSPYQNYNGVITPQIRKAYSEAILCLEKVFRYLKSVKEIRKERSGLGRSESCIISCYGSEVLKLPFDTDLVAAVNVAGPLVVSPFGPSPPIPRSLLHQLTKQIIGLKVALIENPKHKECIRMIRSMQMDPIDPLEAKAVILKLAAVSPSVYLDGILQRIDDNEDSAEEELKMVLMLTEQDTVGMTR
jgi:hypothetical protein